MSTAFGSRKTFILQSLFFSLYLIQEAIWTAADWLHIISHYQEPAAVPLPCWFHSQVARFSHLMEKAGNGREWPKWDGGFESDRYSQHQPAQLEAQARPSKAARLSASVLLLKWSHEMPLKPCEASLQLASRTFGRSTDRRGANEWTRSEEIWTKTMTMMTYDDYELWRFLIIIDINGFNGRIIEPRSFALHWLGLPNQAQTLLGVSEALQV